MNVFENNLCGDHFAHVALDACTLQNAAKAI